MGSFRNCLEGLSEYFYSKFSAGHRVLTIVLKVKVFNYAPFKGPAIVIIGHNWLAGFDRNWQSILKVYEKYVLSHGTC